MELKQSFFEKVLTGPMSAQDFVVAFKPTAEEMLSLAKFACGAGFEADARTQEAIHYLDQLVADTDMFLRIYGDETDEEI